MSSSRENDIRSLRILLRRLKHAAPGVATAAVHGLVPEIVNPALREEELTFSETPDAEAFWLPAAPVIPSSSAKTIAIVSPAIDETPLPFLLAKRTARRYASLKDWVAGWFGHETTPGRLASKILVSPAVGDRGCRVAWKGMQEAIFVRDPATVPPAESQWKDHAVTMFGVGYFPVMPATLASALMVPPALAIYLLFGPSIFFALSILLAIAATILGVALEKWAMSAFLADDPREFVLDEVAGMALAWAFLPWGAGWGGIVLAFFMFRIFDIFKWGVHWVETLPIPGKIVWDDLLAGLYAGLASLGILAACSALLR